MSRQSGKSVVNPLGTPHCAKNRLRSSATEGCGSGAETESFEPYPLFPVFEQELYSQKMRPYACQCAKFHGRTPWAASHCAVEQTLGKSSETQGFLR